MSTEATSSSGRQGAMNYHTPAVPEVEELYAELKHFREVLAELASQLDKFGAKLGDFT